jgi:hypothetical protein
MLRLRTPLSLLALVLAVALAPAAAHAAKITKASATVTDGNIRTMEITNTPTIYHGGLLVEFTEVGVPRGEVVYVITADATATYVCVNDGNNQPNAANKQGVGGPISYTQTIFSDGSGKVIAGIGVPPLGPGAFTCPPGHSVVLSDVSYTNIVLTDTTNGATFSIPGTYSLVLLPLN